ncbi:calcium-binding protein [Streptomyces sp. SID12501]|uniref:Calcium-binding protein n=1 Tax=Streptomyces sp. SID12501 TaxID=2706042 RepID=A0A6B3BPF3_9ACTN|nr:calcium-binding protein [Streptomyces sp. SID12501]NEC86188.1 calcium-binding protein [Streptomyces sp. SID12501]
MGTHRRSTRGSTWPGATAALVVSGLLLPVASAHATEATGTTASSATAVIVDGDHVVYTAANGQTNKVFYWVGGYYSDNTGRQEISIGIDDVVPIDAGPGCVHPGEDTEYPGDPTKVQCTFSDDFSAPRAYPRAIFNLGDGNDTSLSNFPDRRFDVYGGPGNDTLNGTRYTSTGYPNPAGLGFENLHGGTGNDRLTNGRDMYGDDGNDTLSAGNNIWGGNGNDTLTGTAAVNTLNGGSGNDTIRGAGGRDYIYGQAGNDHLYGGAGDDDLYGNSGNDVIYGNGGNDRLYGGPGKDFLSGGPGRNHLVG